MIEKERERERMIEKEEERERKSGAFLFIKYGC